MLFGNAAVIASEVSMALDELQRVGNRREYFLEFWDVSYEMVVKRVQVWSEEPSVLASSGDGHLVLAGSEDGCVSLYGV
jgi:hypothetical protein